MKLNQIFKYYNFTTIRKIIVFVVFFSAVFTSVFSQKNDEFVVVLDAGHGGEDPGKVDKRGYKEKDVALSIVLKIGASLEKKQGIKVLYTRKKDVFVKLKERGNFANRADADLFVSVHCNAHTSQAKGAETWVLGLHRNSQNFKVAKAENEVILMEDNYEEDYKGFDPTNPTSTIGLSLEQEENLDQSLLLATLIQEKFEKSLKRVNRGVKQAGFVVLYQTYMPSVLIETGFLTNRIEGKYLYSKAGQQEMSKSISKSIIDYYNQQQLNVAIGGANDFVDVLETVLTSASQENNTYYKIQLASSKNRVITKAYNFKGLKDVERVSVDGYYKYYLGKYNTKSEAENKLELAKSKGYDTAFIVPFDVDGNIKSATKKIIAKEIHVKKKVDEVYYKVQIASSANKINAEPSNFKGLTEVGVVQVGRYYKYYLGKTSSYNKAKEYLASAKSKNYKTAFIVAFLNNERITLKEALKLQTN